eukprot:7063006-Lingulodinium_polyedra.AAC.1
MTGRCQVSPSHNLATTPPSMPPSAPNQDKICPTSGSADKAADRFWAQLICMPVAAADPPPAKICRRGGCSYTSASCSACGLSNRAFSLAAASSKRRILSVKSSAA